MFASLKAKPRHAVLYTVVTKDANRRPTVLVSGKTKTRINCLEAKHGLDT